MNQSIPGVSVPPRAFGTKVVSAGRAITTILLSRGWGHGFVTKPRFNANRAYCVIARPGVIAFGKTYISAIVYDKTRKTEMWYILVHIFCPMRYYIPCTLEQLLTQ